MARPGYAARAEVAERRAKVLAMRIEHKPYADIAAELGVKEVTVRVDYHRALKDKQAEQASMAGQLIAAEEAKMDALELEAWRVLRARHVTVSQGRIVGRFTGFARDPDTDEVFRDDNDKPIPVFEEIEDDAPVLAAIDRLLKIAERRARLRGHDAPTKVEVSDERRAAIIAIAAELSAGRLGELESGGAGTAAGDLAEGGSGPPAA